MAFDFPASPAEGQVYGPYIYRAPAWRSGVTGVPDAPNDGSPYVRRNGLWEKAGDRLIGRIDLSADLATSALFAIPTDVNLRVLKISGMFRQTQNSQYLMMRLSLDNGVTYKAGASDYTNTFLSTNGSAPSVGAAGASALYLAGSGAESQKLRRNIDAKMTLGDATNFTGVMCMLDGYQAVTAPVISVYAQQMAFVGRPTHIQFMISAGTAIGAGTVVTITGET